jgi:hypothetical protein
VTDTIDAQIKWLGKRLRDCASNHAECTKWVQSQLPTRILDLQYSSDSVLLVDGQDRVGHYAALSHCWGPPSSPPCKTTLSSINAGRRISLNDLTEVFRQAVDVTRRLHIRYLWIDALCIIQDSAEDWQYEASRMASVYQNAHLTIATSRSATSHTPFLQSECAKPEWIYTTAYSQSHMERFDPDTKSKHLARTCAIPFQSSLTEKPGTIYFKELRENAIVRSVIDNSDAPLQSRAWTLQERILSPRMVFFDERGLLWECSAGTILQSRECILEDVSNRWAMYVPSNNDVTRIRMSSQGMRKVLLAKKLPEIDLANLESATDSGLTSPVSTRPHDLWLDVLTAFAQRDITYRSDALVAIAGIVDQMQPIVKDVYLAGIWKHDFRRGLLWLISSGSSLKSEEGHIAPAGALQPNAPSWSWASRIFQPHVAQFIACSVRDMTYIEDLHSAQFVDHELDTIRAPFGKLLINGFACSVVLKGTPFAQWPYPVIGCHFSTSEDISTSVDIDDSSQMVALSENGAGRTWTLRFECLIIGQWAFETPGDEGEQILAPRYYGLLLRPLECENYERLGQVFIEPQMR